jgi:hypothetical protein
MSSRWSRGTLAPAFVLTIIALIPEANVESPPHAREEMMHPKIRLETIKFLMQENLRGCLQSLPGQA